MDRVGLILISVLNAEPEKLNHVYMIIKVMNE